MGQSTFKGGAHPYEGKELSMDSPIREMDAKEELVFPMSQHIGAPATPVVAVGDTVKMGQIIGEASGFISANIVSSVSGEVKAVEPRLLSSGAKATCVVIANDGEYQPVEGLGADRDYTQLTKEEIRQIIKDAGIVGMGGAGFPTNVKVTPKNEEEIDYVIVNGAECEPYLTSDYRLMLERPEDLIQGLHVVLSLFDNAKGVIAIEDNKPEAIAKLQYLTDSDPDIEVKVLKTKYPQGAERQVIYVTTGRKINSKMLPADAGCIVDNVQTVLAIYDAVCKTTPSMSRVVTLTGDAMAEPQNYKVKFGMSHAELLEEAGGLKENAKKLISGGPMMGMAQASADFPVAKGTGAVLAFAANENKVSEDPTCIRCGRCVEACPMHLEPLYLYLYVQKNRIEDLEAAHVMDCIECGACSYICPGRLHLTHSFKVGKQKVKEAAAKAKAAAEAAKAAEEAKKEA